MARKIVETENREILAAIRGAGLNTEDMPALLAGMMKNTLEETEESDES